MSYLYGNNVVKSGLGRITENTPQYAGVVVLSMNDIPLGNLIECHSHLSANLLLYAITGFGIAAQPTEFCANLDPTGNVVLHQADIGEYLRTEDELL